MPHTVPIEVRLLASTMVQSGSAEDWLKAHGVSEDRIDEMVGGTEKTEAETLIEMAGRRCYKSFEVGLNANVTKIRTDIAEYIENILKSGHGSVLEHATYTFAIENVSRVFTGEMNRHRAGMAISEGSMRYIRYEDIPYWLPTSIVESKSDSGELKLKKETTRKVFDKAFQHAEACYSALLEIWAEELAPDSKFKAKKEITSMMRRIIPMGVATGGIWTGNIRALRHICEMRCSAAAEEEILLVASMMLNILKSTEPNLFGDFSTDDNGYSAPKYSKV